MYMECHGFESHPRQLIFSRKSDCLGCAVLLYLVCLFALLASFLLPFHLSFKNMTVYICMQSAIQSSTYFLANFLASTTSLIPSGFLSGMMSSLMSSRLTVGFSVTFENNRSIHGHWNSTCGWREEDGPLIVHQCYERTQDSIQPVNLSW